jgi:hypothetical protein
MLMSINKRQSSGRCSRSISANRLPTLLQKHKSFFHEECCENLSCRFLLEVILQLLSSRFHSFNRDVKLSALHFVNPKYLIN